MFLVILSFCRLVSTRHRHRQLNKCLLQNRDQINRIAPGIRLFHARCVGIASYQAGQHRLRIFPTDNIECFKGFVGEIEGMTDINIAVIGDPSKEHIRHLAVIGTAL